MEFELFSLVVHALYKRPDEQEVSVHCSNTIVTIDERSTRLAARLHHIFSLKNDVLQGHLAAPEDALFPAYMQELHSAQYTPEALLAFSRESTQALQLGLQGVPGAKGGYLVFTHYSTNGREYLGIFLVRDTDGVIFQINAQQGFELQPTSYLDIDKLALACRIALDRIEGHHVPVEAIKHAKSQKDISDYFINWLAMETAHSSHDLTVNFLEAVAQLPAPIIGDASITPSAFREQVADFAMKSPAKTISIAAFDEHFYGEERPLQTLLEQQESPLTQEFRFDRGAVNDFNFHKFKGQGYYFGCRVDLLATGKISLNGDQVIIQDESLAAELYDLLQQLRS